MQLSELIDLLARLRVEHGDGPVKVLDVDTSLEMPVDAIRRAADGVWLIDGEGYYTDSPEVCYSTEPLATVWDIGRDPLPAPGAGNDFIQYTTLKTERGDELVVIVSRALFGRLMSAVPEGIGER